jgi:YaiO family outer membrane protein
MKTITPVLLLALGVMASPTGAAPLNLNVDHTSYTGGQGTRTVTTADMVARLSEDSKLYLIFSGGERAAGGNRVRSVRISGTLRHDWSSRLSTNVTAAAATNAQVFARNEFAGEVNYKLTDGIVATAGGKYASYLAGDHVTFWSGGLGYYARGLTATYRFSLINSHLLGRSHAHLASIRLKDPGGSGATQLWFGQGTSLYDLVPEQSVKAGDFTSLTLRREQPLAAGIRLNFGLNRTWYRTPRGNYRGTGLLAGVSVANPFFQ